MLSNRQQRIIEFIRQFWADKGYPPTIRDIVYGCEVSSTSVVNYNLNILEREGYIKRDREVSRGIKLEHAPGSHLPIPIIGTIAAGKPIPVPSADSWNTTAGADTIEVPETMVNGKDGVYALKVKGTSMIDSLINDGDIVLMQQVNSVENGQTAAVWLKAEKEVTLKKVYVTKKNVRLQPANSQMQPIYADHDNVEIQGKVIGVIRRLG